MFLRFVFPVLSKTTRNEMPIAAPREGYLRLRYSFAILAENFLGFQFAPRANLAQHTQEDAGGGSGADNPGHIGAHSMHQEKIPWVSLLAHLLHYP